VLGSEYVHSLCHMQWLAPEVRQLLAQRISAGYVVYKMSSAGGATHVSHLRSKHDPCRIQH